MKEGSRFSELDGKLSPSTFTGLKRKGASAHDSSNEKSLKKTPSFMLDETFQSLNKSNLTQNQNKHDTLTYGPLTQSIKLKISFRDSLASQLCFSHNLKIHSFNILETYSISLLRYTA